MEDEVKRITFIRLLGTYLMNGLRRFMENDTSRDKFKNFKEILQKISKIAEDLELRDVEH